MQLTQQLTKQVKYNMIMSLHSHSFSMEFITFNKV